MNDTTFIKEIIATNEDIVATCKRIAEEIERDFEGEPLTLLCVLKGSLPFTAELIKHFKRQDVELEFLRASSYEGSTTESKGIVDLSCNTFHEIDGKNIVVIEDILDTGRTLQAVNDYLYAKHAKTIKLCTLLDKPERREIDISADYVGYTIPNHFVIGFGLDYNEAYRGMPDIVIPHPDKL